MRIPKFIKRRGKLLAAMACVLLPGVSYPAFVLGYTWYHVLRSDLPGGGNGPLDAYRHTLASAVVAYTLDEKVVHAVSKLMEFRNWPTHRMDRHNNHLGTRIAAEVGSFSQIEPAVARRVALGRINASGIDEATWLSKGWWKERRMW